MPTGYTADVKQDTTLEQFVWRCARAFGALVMMRDDPNDAPIPRAFEPSSFYRDQLEKDEKELGEIEAWSDTDALADQERKLSERRQMFDGMNAESVERRNAYARMLAMVTEWEPPSGDHAELKKFMIQQLRESTQFDCHEYGKDERQVPVSAAEWKSQRRIKAVDAVARDRVEWAKEQERVAGRNRWLEQLRESLVNAPMPR